MQEIQNWLMGIVIAIMGAVMWWIVQKAVNSIITILKEIKGQLELLNNNLIKHEQQIIHMQDEIHELKGRVLNLEKAA